jgi:predicted lipoprotein with Yx(FWY)xxD motif
VTVAADAATRPAVHVRQGITVRTLRSAYGTVVGDRAGRAFYSFDRERSADSRCYGDCAKSWPPVLTNGRPVPGRGVRARLLGTTQRRDGRRQLTYRGKPMYYYVGDSAGRVLCQNVVEFGGRWLVIRPDGRAIN